MNRYLFSTIFLIIIIPSSSFSQGEYGLSFNSEFNRIGIGTALSINYQELGHEGGMGIKYYPLNHVFQSDIIGLSLMYAYNISNDKWRTSMGAQGSFFRENKNSSELYVSDIQLVSRMGRNWSKFFAYGIVGFGVVLNKYSSFSGQAGTIAYWQGSVGIGIQYKWQK